MPVRTPDKPHRIKQDSLFEFDEDGTYIATAKYDGYRCIVDWDGSKAACFSRRGSKQGGPTEHPIGPYLKEQLQEWLIQNKISPNTRFDGEWLKFRTKCDPVIVIFGIQYSNSKWIGTEPELVRWELTKSFDYNIPGIMLAESVESNYSKFFNDLKQRDYTINENDWKCEGIVLKHVRSTLVGRLDTSAKNSLWFKAKWRDGASGKIDTF